MMMMKLFIGFLVLIVSCNAFSLHKSSFLHKSILSSARRPITTLFATKEQIDTSIHNMYGNNAKRIAAIVCSSLLTLTPIFSVNIAMPVYADSKEDKQFELCISKCIFEETKPPPIGASTERLEVTKTRVEIVRECRVKCAKNKQQLLIGKPKIKAQQAQTKEN